VILSKTTTADVEAAGIEEDQIPPETLAVIAAAVTAFLGRNFRILTVSHSLQANRWTRQGRTLVQASHNVRTKR